VTQLIEGLSYKPEGRGFHTIFHLHNSSGRTMTLRSILPVTEMSKVKVK